MNSSSQLQRVILLWLAFVFCGLGAFAQSADPCVGIRKQLQDIQKAIDELETESAKVPVLPSAEYIANEIEKKSNQRETIKEQLRLCEKASLPSTGKKDSPTASKQEDQAPAPTHQGALPSSPGTFSSDEELFAYQESYPDNPYAKGTKEYRAEESRRMREWKQKHPNWALEQARKNKSAAERAKGEQIEKDKKESQDRNAQDPTYAKRKAEADAKMKAWREGDEILGRVNKITGQWVVKSFPPGAYPVKMSDDGSWAWDAFIGMKGKVKALAQATSRYLYTLGSDGTGQLLVENRNWAAGKTSTRGTTSWSTSQDFTYNIVGEKVVVKYRAQRLVSGNQGDRSLAGVTAETWTLLSDGTIDSGDKWILRKTEP